MVPVAAVFGTIGSLMGKAVTSIMVYFTMQKAIKLTIVVAGIGAVFKLSQELAGFMDGLIADAATALPSDSVAFFAAVMPSNLVFCISLVVTAEGAKWLYLKNQNVIEWIMK